METSRYLDRLLLKYSNTFNIYKPYHYCGIDFPAYGFFEFHNEKYVLVREANMWSSDSYEHVFFWQTDSVTPELFQKARDLIENHMEPELVRKGEKLPAQNHMCTLMTIIFICDEQISSDVFKMIRRYRFDKGYQFQLRGYSRGRIAAISMKDRKVVFSPDLRGSRKMFHDVFTEVDDGKDGFDAVCERQNIQSFRQEI